MAASSRQTSGASIKHIPLNMVLRVAVIFLMVSGFLLYVSIFISPALLRKVLLGVGLCNSKATDTSNAMRSGVPLSNALDRPTDHQNHMMKEEYSISERSGATDPRAPPLTCKGTTAGSGDRHEVEKILKESNKTDAQDGDRAGDRLGVEKTLKESNKTDAQNGDQGGESSRDLKTFSVLVGVMTTASKMDRRSLLRLAYNAQSSADARISVRFVVGGLDGGGEGGGVDRTLVGMENATYGDIIVLSCAENLNEGKTFTFFSSLPDRGLQYDYVMKTDDDSYIRFDNLGRSLKPLPRTDLYYGYILPCDNEDPYSWYMAGMGYLISWDLVLWIRDSPIARNKSVGTEDQLVGDWFNEGGVAKNRVNEKPRFYDHPEFGGQCAHELVPETILVHQVKTPERWADVLGFFEKDRISRALSLSS